ncbi:MAG: sulfite exporter TauE/SafE family protein [Alphaproteobacteria bacterium]|nr:sulfite exporter TauE/SafE family protein [Alphaproteobacteria bacterium]
MDAVFVPDLALAAAIALAGGVIKGFAGFGGGIFMMPLLTVLYGPVEAVAMVLLLEVPTTFQLLPRAIRETNWTMSLPISAGLLLTIPLGSLVLVSADPDWIRRGMGTVVILFSIVMYAGWRYPGPFNRPASFVTGLLAGFAAGAAAMGGTITGLYMLSASDDSARIRGSNLLFAAIIIAFLLALLAWFEAILAATVWRSVLLAPVVIAGAWAGTHFFDRSNERLFRHVALGVIAASGLTALVK